MYLRYTPIICVMELVLPAKVVLLRAQSNNIVGFRRKGKTFVIGVCNKALVKKCASHISPESGMFLRELSLTDVKQDLLGISSQSVMVDTDAKLVITKKVPEPFFYQTVNTEEFMMYPFKKNIGIVLVDDLTRETNKELVLNAHVIAPTFSPEQFENF